MKPNEIYHKLIAGKTKLAVVGLGYVGMPIAFEFAKYIQVIGFDINERKIKEYRNGVDAEGKIHEPLNSVSIDFTSDPARLREASFIIVAVPTPLKTDNSPDLGPLKEASRIIGKYFMPGSIVVVESTVYPGVTEEVCVPVIENESGLTCGKDWKIGYSPERINPGDKEHTLPLITKVVSGMDTESAAEIQKVYNIVIKAGTFLVSDIKTAEAIKVVENSQRDINIAFMNEIAVICHKMGINTDEIIQGMNTKWNALGFTPGLVGGHCIGVDPYYLAFAAEKQGYQSRIILSGRQVNDSMGPYVADAAVKSMVQAGLSPDRSTVVIMGVTFKEDWPDIRNSKVIDMIHRLGEYGIKPVVTDVRADAAAVEEEYGLVLVPEENIPKADCVIVAVGHSEYKAMSIKQIKAMFKQNTPDHRKVLVDVKRIYRPDELRDSGMHVWTL